MGDIFLIFSPEDKISYSMQIVSINLFSGKKKKKYFNMSSADNFTKSAKNYALSRCFHDYAS